jgi:hypothetical protein
VRTIPLLVIVCLLALLVVAVAFAVPRTSSPDPTAPTPVGIDYALTADCLSDHQSWRNFNSTLADLERDLRWCIEVWPTAQLITP